MNIKEVESLTGITKQNIRFYEKKGLLRPQRNETNSYRKYTDEDIETLKRIKMYRKLDISLENIEKILDGEAVYPIIQTHLNTLLMKQSELDAAISMCRFLLHNKKDSLDVEYILQKMEYMEEKGGHFMSIVKDYKKVAKAERKKAFPSRRTTWL